MLNDKTIRLKAKGLLSQMLSLPGHLGLHFAGSGCYQNRKVVHSSNTHIIIIKFCTWPKMSTCTTCLSMGNCVGLLMSYRYKPLFEESTGSTKITSTPALRIFCSSSGSVKESVIR